MDLIAKYTEHELVFLLKAKDEKVFSYLYENYSGGLYSIISQIIPDPEQADDVLQETFVNIWTKIDSYDSRKGKLFTWMLNVARNLSIDTLRSKAYRNSLRNQSTDEYDYPEHAVMITQQIINSMGLKKAVQQLKPEYGGLIDLAYFKGYTQEEIAEIAGLPLGTVKTRIRTALIQLRAYLQ
ncbi:RNA polymerase sigma factor [Chitinophagaceae bacterium LWZ2-11]